MSEVTERADRFERLWKDSTFQELMTGIQQQQISIFLDTCTKIEDVERARAVVSALDEIERYITSKIDSGKIERKREKSAP